jgi:transposase
MQRSATEAASAPTVIGVDIGKEVFHLVGFDALGKIVLRRKIKRLALADTFRALAPCVVGMEACLSAHFVSRTLRALGFTAHIIPAIYVKPFLKGQKNDFNDAEAIAEAALRPHLRTVREKTQAELDLQAYHRIRSRLVSRRTATINQIRAFLIEQGIAVRTGAAALRKSLFEILKSREDEISPRMADLIVGLYEDWLRLNERIEGLTDEIEQIARTQANCRLLMSVPGVGPVISTALVAAIGDGEAFERGRDFGAWLGLVPRQHSTGGRTSLGRISKRGDKYLRMLFIQAAKVLLMRPNTWERFSFGVWLRQLAPRVHRNKLATALANKLARISWSVLHSRKAFDTHLEEALPAI